MKLSTIIPVHNAGKYLKRCLDSVISQNMTDTEIICVDDGSVDDSFLIMEEYAGRYENVRVIKQENLHAGIARNRGMDIACGEYIHFLDADDYLFPDVYERMYELARSTDADYVKILAKSFEAVSGQEVKEQPECYSASFMDADEFGRIVSVDTFPAGLIENAFVTPWSGIYRHDFLERNHIRFNDLMCVNDRSFYIQVVLSTKRIIYMNLFAVWHQVGNDKSLKGIRGDHFECHFRSWHEIEALTQDCAYDLQKRILTAEMHDIFYWFGQMTESQRERAKDGIYRFFSTVDWAKMNRNPEMFQRMSEINQLLDAYGKAETISIADIEKASRTSRQLYVYGFGVMGKGLIRYLQSLAIRPECVIVSDSQPENTQEDVPVKRISNVVFPDDRGDVTVFLAAKSLFHQQMLRQLKRYDIRKIFTLSDEGFEKLKEFKGRTEGVFHATSVSPESIVRKRTPRKELVIVLDLTEHCNLNCQSCDHFSPLSQEYYMSYEQFRKDIKRLWELMGDKLKAVKLEGGEPLLNPEIERYVRYIRKELPNTDIQIITNGLLLPGMPNSFWNTLKECRVVIRATKYPIDFDYSVVEELAERKNVKFIYYNAGQRIKTSKYKPLDISGSQDKHESFHYCLMANGECADLKNGRLYPCTFAANAHIFNEYFGKSLEIGVNDSIDIYQDITAEDIFDFMCNPIPACRYCKSGEWMDGYRWKTSSKNIGEWI